LTNAGVYTAEVEVGEGRGGDFIKSLTLSYLVAALLLGALVYFAGVWSVLANTRLLDVLVSGGIVRQHDVHMGFVDGLPDPELLLLTQDAIDWRLVGGVVALYFVFWGIKSFQFHRISRFMGMSGSLSEHSSAYLYGSGLNILWPFRLGNAAVVASCAARAESSTRAGAAIYAAEVFVLFEVFVFGLIGLGLNGWTTWLGELFWALVIALTAFLIVRRARPGGVWIPGRASASDKKLLIRRFAESPSTLAAIAALSLLAFLIDDVTPYLMSQAFTNDFVILNVPFPVIQMGVVAGYIARQISITPGGIGQFEWGFAAALVMAGVGLPEAATIALLESAVRHGTGLFLFGTVMVWKGAHTHMSEVMPRVLASPAQAHGQA